MAFIIQPQTSAWMFLQGTTHRWLNGVVPYVINTTPLHFPVGIRDFRQIMSAIEYWNAIPPYRA